RRAQAVARQPAAPVAGHRALINLTEIPTTERADTSLADVSARLPERASTMLRFLSARLWIERTGPQHLLESPATLRKAAPC
ncbi:MAG: hypothetical protein ACREXV_09930, partial [Polaromonas sp.]